ncbi:MAG: DUF4258 domain-containing protein [Pseudomonadota bacterium]
MPILSREDAAESIKRILDHPVGRLMPVWSHLSLRGQQRDFDIVDIEYVFQDFDVVSEPEYHAAHHNWRCKVRGKDPEGDTLTVLVGISEEELTITVITAW